ncbi:hypothetical protein [Helicobacter sp.]|uniref:hypothetical protein n=1 Tax=Helicobacter sp. TaxID=218 RepID=UPI0025BF6B41|nr:hypothetical protein [Helicobacter sp.]MCI5969429.1 hypothetical protein [Helicobacter sp.]MDY2585684.1 hypothetical protein [Helicobacter sp.]
MNKLLATTFGSLLLSSALFANTLDKDSIKISFEGYKAPQMVGVKGKFTTSKVEFKDNSSFAKQIVGASITLSPNDIDMSNPVITNNIINAFFNTLNNKGDVKVELVSLIEGKDVGTITAKVTINNQSTTMPLVYKIQNGDMGKKEFTAEGRIDLAPFSNTTKALKALSDAAPGHLKISWNVVDIFVTGTLK